MLLKPGATGEGATPTPNRLLNQNRVKLALLFTQV